MDPLTGREQRLAESTTDEAEAKRILSRFRAQVDAQQNARTKATLDAAIDAWLWVHAPQSRRVRGVSPRRFTIPGPGSRLQQPAGIGECE